MKEKSILVVDDSSTIRRLVDRELGNAGYRVLLAENAEQGMAIAHAEKPDLILLDHQLPGTTGFKVCGQLLQDEGLRTIPVVVSSTLRKKAYVEYTDCSNVVDMLPKPYTGDLLRTTVANALDTATLIVQSQSAGTAVPEVMDACADSELLGTFSIFNVRELIDFLTNGAKHGALELECERSRICIFLDKGRIQAITASGINPSDVAEHLPEALADLAPMVKFTIAGRQTSQLDGIVELLDNKVLDARLLRQLLRHQAAVLLMRCFEKPPKSFRFDARQSAPALFTKLPLDISLLALLVDAAMMSNAKQTMDEKLEFTRKTIRGQNLDRAGLSAAHMKFLTMLNSPLTSGELASQAGCSVEEARGVLRGLELAELIVGQSRSRQHNVIALCADSEKAQQVSAFLRANETSIQGKVVRDALAVKLLLRRSKPNLMIVDMDQTGQVDTCKQLQTDFAAQLSDVKWYGITKNPSASWDGMQLDRLIAWNRLDQELRECLNLECGDGTSSEQRTEMANCV